MISTTIELEVNNYKEEMVKRHAVSTICCHMYLECISRYFDRTLGASSGLWYDSNKELPNYD